MKSISTVGYCQIFLLIVYYFPSATHSNLISILDGDLYQSTFSGFFGSIFFLLICTISFHEILFPNYHPHLLLWFSHKRILTVFVVRSTKVAHSMFMMHHAEGRNGFV